VHREIETERHRHGLETRGVPARAPRAATLAEPPNLIGYQILRRSAPFEKIVCQTTVLLVLDGATEHSSSSIIQILCLRSIV